MDAREVSRINYRGRDFLLGIILLQAGMQSAWAITIQSNHGG